MNRKQEIQILIPQLEKQYGEAHDVFDASHKEQLVRVKKHLSLVIGMNHNDFDLWFNETRTTLTFEVDGEKSGELNIKHPVIYKSEHFEDTGFELSWYSTSRQNDADLTYLIALGKIAEDFKKGDEGYLKEILTMEIEKFHESIKEQREIGSNLSKLKSELQEIERVEKFQSVYDNGGIRGEFNVYGKIEKGRTIGCVSLAVDKVTDKTVTVTFRTEFYGEVTKRLKKREADGLFVSIVDTLSQKEEA